MVKSRPGLSERFAKTDVLGQKLLLVRVFRRPLPVPVLHPDVLGKRKDFIFYNLFNEVFVA